jgi:hypothetical protein
MPYAIPAEVKGLEIAESVSLERVAKIGKNSFELNFLPDYSFPPCRQSFSRIKEKGCS